VGPAGARDGDGLSLFPDLDFLRGHIAQLTQTVSQLSLKPSEEEIKKKG